MASWLKWLTRRFRAPPAPVPARPARPVKSAERVANERQILEIRREILAKIDVLRAERKAKQRVAEIIDQDTMRAAQVVRAMLNDLDREQKS